jgi:hypothetical protein
LRLLVDLFAVTPIGKTGRAAEHLFGSHEGSEQSGK